MSKPTLESVKDDAIAAMELWVSFGMPSNAYFCERFAIIVSDLIEVPS